MKKHHLIFLLIGVIMIGVLIIYWITHWSWLFSLDKDDAAIGSAIGGITAPFIGIIGATLVFYTFIEQNKANKLLNELNDFRFFIDLIQELKRDIDKLYDKDVWSDAYINRTNEKIITPYLKEIQNNEIAGIPALFKKD